MIRSPRIVLTALAAAGLAVSAPSQEPPGMLATAKYLFVVRGDWVYQLDIDTLALRNRTRLGGDVKEVIELIEVGEDAVEDAPLPRDVGEVAEPAAPTPVVVKAERPRDLRPKSEQPAGASTKAAIDAGLTWLARHQDENGKWDADGFMKHDKGAQPCDGPGNPVHDIGATGLAMLAMLGSGSTLRSGPYRDNLKRAARWMREQQQETGLFGVPAAHDFIYDHAIATYAMCEAYGLSNYKLLKMSAQQALNYIESHRNPYAVWRYQPRDNDNDTSVTSWCLIALKSGQYFDLEVNKTALEMGAAWLDQVTTVDGRCGYTKRGENSSRMPGDHAVLFPVEKTETLTAAGLFCRFFLGQDPKDKPVMKAAADRLLEKPVAWDEKAGTIDHYYWYYGTYAMFQMGGKHWEKWQQRLGPAVEEHQRKVGNFRGSWDPVGVWGESGGRVYSTALMVLTLEASYRYTRLVR